MSLLRFAHFTFDTLTLELCANTKPVALRPKTAELLRELITRRDGVLNKRQLIKRIWHTEHVTDQSVFQAVSELRQQLAPLNAIRTFPNRGYQWVLPVIEVNPKRRALALAIAATVLLSALGLAGVNSLVSSAQLPQATVADHSLQTPELPMQVAQNNASYRAPHSLPAMVAFSEGASALQRGDTQQALDQLQLSVIERPDFVEARLLLAEAYLLHGDALQARQRADNVMRSLSAYASAYATIAAMDLLSRADQQLGQMNSALEWATRAADQANTNGYECTAADLHDRVLALVQDHNYSPTRLEASPVFASEFARSMLQAAFAEQERSTSTAGVLAQSSLPGGSANADTTGAQSLDELLGHTAAADRPAHCERYRGGPSGQLSPVRTSEQSVADHVSFGAIAKPLI